MNSIFEVILTIVVIYLISRIIYAYNLLSGLSDDVNDIKKKLGLKTDARTHNQIYERDCNYINRTVLSGKTQKELKETLGFWMFHKYKGEIEMALKNYPERKICPDCKGLWGPYSERCCICETKTIPFKEYQKTYPDEKGNVDGYV